MEYFDALMKFLKTIFDALTKFLGRSIPVISDIDAIIPSDDTDEGGEG